MTSYTVLYASGDKDIVPIHKVRANFRIEASKSFPKDLEPKIAANNPVNPIEPMLSAQHKISIASLTRRALPAPVLEEMLSSMILDMLNGSTMNKPSRAMHAKSVLPTLQTVADLLKDNEYGDDK
ncbi:hypothetical protein BX616_010824 [Lobosporangium transversale]|nr:hypothetical protein BX616_010824 [Lobosporangium transversale]